LRGTVLFVHGLWMTGAESFLLKRNLATHGWNLRAFPYSSFAEPVSRVARRCARYAQLVARRTLAPVHLVGHSLGGLIVYRMFETGLLAPDRFSGDFCRVVFMGTPALGTQSDGTVAVSETAIEGATDRFVIHASHMGMLVAAETAEQIASFLEVGHFDRNPM
jgi:pimeloyl-ACP methyl ester carboxylesterase